MEKEAELFFKEVRIEEQTIKLVSRNPQGPWFFSSENSEALMLKVEERLTFPSGYQKCNSPCKGRPEKFARFDSTLEERGIWERWPLG